MRDTERECQRGFDKSAQDDNRYAVPAYKARSIKRPGIVLGSKGPGLEVPWKVLGWNGILGGARIYFFHAAVLDYVIQSYNYSPGEVREFVIYHDPSSSSLPFIPGIWSL